jgi:tetratricopeptide (TPR) repeat protein
VSSGGAVGSPGAALAAVQAALAAGDAARARALADAALTAAPDDPNLRQLRALASLRLGQAAAALADAEAVVQAAPHVAGPRVLAGNALAALARWPDAELAFRAALAIRPDHADAWYNLGVARRAQGDNAGAGAAFGRAGSLNPSLHEALQGVIDCAAALAAGDADAPPVPRTLADDPGRPWPLLSFVIPSIDPTKFASVRASIAARFDGVPHEIVGIHDGRAMAEALNRGGDRARGEWLVFCHDDITFVAADFAARLKACLEHHDLVGVAGTTRLTGPSITWSGAPHVHGWITHVRPDGVLRPSIAGARCGVIAGAEGLDGVFLAMRRASFEQIRFDAATFDGWHGYDLDFSLRAARAGLSCAIATDLTLTHASYGSFDAAYARYAQAFCDKHAPMPTAPQVRSPFFATSVDHAGQLERLYGWVASWLTSTTPRSPDGAQRNPG